MKTTKTITTDEGLNYLAEELIKKGFSIIAPGNPSTYFHFFKDGKMGYVQKSYFFGYDFSLSCKPSRETGTGSGIMQEVAPTIENAIKTINTPFPVYNRNTKPKFWESPEEYISYPVNQILKPYIIK